MTILEPGPVVVSPAPDTLSVVAPPQEPQLQIIQHRRSRAPLSLVLGFLVALAAVAAALAAWSPWTSPSSGTPASAQPPSYVRLVGVTAHSVAFRWSPPLTDASVVGYEIVRNGVVADVVMPGQSSYDATGLAAGRAYRFQVVALFAHTMSAPSAPIVATTPS